MQLEGETNLGRQHIRVGLETFWVRAFVVPEPSSMQEVPLDLAVKIGIKVIASGQHPVLRIILRQGRVQRFIVVVTVIASHLQLSGNPVASHPVPGAPIERKDERSLRTGNNIGEWPAIIFAGKIPFSSSKLGIVYGDMKRSNVQVRHGTRSVDGLD